MRITSLQIGSRICVPKANCNYDNYAKNSLRAGVRLSQQRKTSDETKKKKKRERNEKRKT